MRLIEYLEHARKLENDIYLCDVTINNLENKISELEREREDRVQRLENYFPPEKSKVYKRGNSEFFESIISAVLIFLLSLLLSSIIISPELR